MQADEHNREEPKRRRLPFVFAGLVGCLALIFLLCSKIFFPTHPQFGAIYEATAFDLNEARSDRLAVFLRRNLPDRIVRSPYFPACFKDQPRYLRIGNTQLEWSMGGTNTGWLYFWGLTPNRGLVKEKWEFAPCAETDFLKVTKSPVRFCGANDPLRSQVFGANSTTNAIQVVVGQILFARRTDATNRIYVIKFKAQRMNKLVVQYCETNQ